MIDLMDFFYGAEESYRRVWVSHNDLDGYGCFVVGDVLLRMTRNNKEIVHTNISKVNVGIPNDTLDVIKGYMLDHTMFLITDLRINRETIDYLIDNKCPFVVVDHHIWADDDYDRVKEYSPHSTISTAYSATKLLYNKFGYESAVRFGTKLENKLLEKYADSVSDYDTGNWGNWSKAGDKNVYTPALKEQLIFSRYRSNVLCVTYCKIMTKRFCADTNDERDDINKKLDGFADDAFSKIYDQYEIVMKNLMTTNLYENSVLVPFTVPFISVIAKKILEDNSKLNYLFYINPEYKMVGIRSLADHPELNCQEIGIKYGGGGHQHAAGFNLTSLDFYVSGGNAAFRFSPK